MMTSVVSNATGVVVPRRVVAVFDGNSERAPRYTRIHRYAELPLNYLGYELDYFDISREVPPAELGADVAAVLTWFDTPPQNSEAFVDWAATVRRAGPNAAGLKLIAFGDPGLSLLGPRSQTGDAYLARLGLDALGYEHRFGIWSRVSVSNSEFVGFERDFTIAPGLLPVLVAHAPDAETQLRITSDPAGGVASDLVVTGKGGGYASDAALVRNEGSGFGRWILNPFSFFEKVLAPGARPIPDPTTLSGRRIYFSTISGEGWTTTAPADRLDDAPVLAGSIVIDQFLTPYPDLPASLALVTGDLDPVTGGKFAQSGAELAQSAFTLPQVEAASRSRTLPTRWGFFENYRREDELAIVDQLGRTSRPIDRGLLSEAVSTLGKAFAPADAGAYLGGDAPRRYMAEPFDLASEIGGSLAAVGRLEPEDTVAPLLTWSGDADVFEAALKLAREAGAEAIGGGGGVFDPTVPTLSNLAPISVPVRAERQIYAALSDDAVFTNFWTNPSHGFVRFAKTLETTERPRRLKPFQLAYSAYSALNFGLRNSVRFHLDHARTAAVTPIPASRYAAIAAGFDTTRLVTLDEDRWQIENRGALETVRFDSARRKGLDMARSSGVLGARREGAALYVALDAKTERPIVALAAAAGNGPDAAAPSIGSERGWFILDNARWSIEGLSQTSCLAGFSASGFGPGEMTWRVPAAGPYKVEVFEEGATDPIYWDDLEVAEDRVLTLVLPEMPLRKVRVTVSGC